MKKFNYNPNHKYGQFCTDQDIIKNWSAVDYLINNQQLFRSKSEIYPLIPTTNRIHIAIKKILYALINLTIKNNKKYFSMSEIQDHIKKQNFSYLIQIENKASYIATVSINSAREKCNVWKNHDTSIKLNERINYNYEQIFKFKRNVRNNDFYAAIAFLWNIFISIKTSYNTNSDQIKDKRVKHYYGLNKEGLKLIKKINDENYVL